MRIYEELFILRPESAEEEIDAFIEQLTQVVTTGGGVLDKVEKWGKRKLAYRVEKREEGFYVLLQFTSGPDVVREIERRMRVSEQVLKYITVRIDEKLKRIDKRRKAREKRAARKPAPVSASVPGAPSAEQVMAAGAETPGVRE